MTATEHEKNGVQKAQQKITLRETCIQSVHVSSQYIPHKIVRLELGIVFSSKGMSGLVIVCLIKDYIITLTGAMY